MKPIFHATSGLVLMALCLAACSKTRDKEPRDAGMDASQDAQHEAAIRTCEYGGRTYSSGSEFCGIQGCNGCICDQIQEGGVGCTLIGCSPYADAGVELCRRTSWHQPDQSEATTLQLYGDGSFRWLALSCESFSRDVGLWSEAEGTVTLSPAPGRSDFAWPGGTTHSELQLTRDADALTAQLNEPQIWQRGGRCPICNNAHAGTDAGTSTIEACDNPFAYCNESTMECKAR